MTIDKIRLGTLLATVDVAKSKLETMRKTYGPEELTKVVELHAMYIRKLEALAEAVREAIS